MATKTIYSAEYRGVVDERRRVREASGQNQAELARRMGWSQQRLSAVETGARRLDVMEYFQLADVLGLSPEHALRIIVQARRK